MKLRRKHNVWNSTSNCNFRELHYLFLLRYDFAGVQKSENFQKQLAQSNFDQDQWSLTIVREIRFGFKNSKFKLIEKLVFFTA